MGLLFALRGKSILHSFVCTALFLAGPTRTPPCGAAASIVDLHPRGVGCERSYANDTDGRRQVGYGYFPAQADNAPYRALLWSGTAGSVEDLHSMLPADFAQGGSIAQDVDDEGNIVGLAQRPDGSTVAVLWRRADGSPAPPPAQLRR